MEKLKSVIPQTLIDEIYKCSDPNDLPSTCNQLHEIFLQLPIFHQMVKDLTGKETALGCKNKEAALEFKEKGNRCFSNDDDSNALRFYTKALCLAPTDADNLGRNLAATLYLNRAALLQRMGLLVESLRDCDRALVLCSGYAKAWYRRGKANSSLGNHEDAVRDWNIAISVESSLSGKSQIEKELKLILNQNCEKKPSLTRSYDVSSKFVDQPLQMELQCVSTESKGRGMISLNDIPQATLIHSEEAYAAIILKHCRETHCHFCLNELPADIVPCPSCSFSLYCSQQCQVRAGGRKVQNDSKTCDIQVSLSGDLGKYIADVTRSYTPGVLDESDAEHSHECHGVNWPKVLPSEMILAGRVLMKSMEHKMHFSEGFIPIGNLGLSHNYMYLDLNSKLELHISSIILLYCLRQSYDSIFQINSISISQCIILLCQMKVNSMAIVRIKTFDANETQSKSRILSSAGDCTTSTVKQVRVGLALYLKGSLFNHSCQPNIHTYFFSRTLCIRSTEFVGAGQPLELSYGPQVGEWNCKDRQQSLQEQYSFTCQCIGCAELNLSDLVINAFRCMKPDCYGVVFNRCLSKYEKMKVTSRHEPFNCEKVCNPKIDGIKRVAGRLFDETDSSHQVKPGYCLNCGVYRDLEPLNEIVSEARICFRRLEIAFDSDDAPTDMVSDALKSLDLIKSALHPYNKKIAEAEDNLAQAFCFIGELQHARERCEASIEILEKLYGFNHIVIGNELVKLASIQVYLWDHAVVERFKRMDMIFSRYYGSHVDIIFPHLQVLKRLASKFVG